MARTTASQQAGNGTFLLILIQVASRGLTFIGNQFLLRFLSPALLGIAVQLELVSVTTLYFARESLRVALQRQPAQIVTDERKTQKERLGQETQNIVNLSYLAIFLGLIISAFFGWSYVGSAQQEVLDSPYFGASSKIYGIATLIELFAEPAFVIIQQKGLYKDRARVETTAAIARCCAACATAVVGYRQGLAPSILPFASGQLAYATVLLALYLAPVLRLSNSENFSITPSQLETSTATSTHYFGLFEKVTVSLASTMYLQSIFKLLLTQGDALIMSFLASLADQGSFALASNYGGLLARLIFQPVEESSRNTFGRLLSPVKEHIRPTDSAEPVSKDKKAGATDADQRTSDTRAAMSYLQNTLRLYLVLTRPLVTVGPFLILFGAQLFLSPQWRALDTLSLLVAYVYYIPLTALNGILDAFVTSVATPAQLRTQSLWMLIFTGIYAVAAWFFLRVWSLGSVGLIFANMVNMVLRIVWSWHFIKQYTKSLERQDGQLEGLWLNFSFVIKQRISGAIATIVVELGIFWIRNFTVSGSAAGLDPRHVDGTKLAYLLGLGLLSFSEL
jgi:hypothetical protein